MKRSFTILTAALLAIMGASCSNNQAASALSSTSGSSLFTATIDGQTYSSPVSAGMFNLAGNQVDDSKQPYLLFLLADAKSTDDLRTTRTIRLVVAKKTGSVHLTRAVDIPNYGIDLDYMDGDFSKYRPEDVQLNITDLSATRVKGNFAGKMYHIDPVPPGSKNPITVDVRFDIPIDPAPAP